MKLIHTSDWHLGHRLYNYDRAEEESRFFAQLAEAVAAERPDALLVAGDVYHTGSPGNDVARAFTERLLQTLAGSPQTEAVVIAGNHDSYSRLEIARELWKRCRVHVVGTTGENADGTADFARNVIRIGDRGVIAAVPFCHPRNFPAVPGGAREEDRMAAYFRGLRAYVEALNAGSAPTVLVAHLAAGRGTDFTGQDRGGVIGGEECVEVASLGAGYDYIALGHIHCPQWVKADRRVARYCGTPRPIHFDETHPHGVDVVEVSAGRDPVLKTRVLTPLRELVTIGGKSGLPFADALKELSGRSVAEGSYVRFNVALGPGERVQVEWTERARQAAESRKLRFCLVNPVSVAAEQAKGAARELTMQELKELSDEEVLAVLSAARQLTDRQRELLRGLMAEIAEPDGKGMNAR